MLSLREKKNQNPRISDQFSPPSCQARNQHRTLHLFTKTQKLVREHGFCGVNHVELTRIWTFSPQVPTTFPKKMGRRSVEQNLHISTTGGCAQAASLLRAQPCLLPMSRAGNYSRSGEMVPKVCPTTAFLLMKIRFSMDHFNLGERYLSKTDGNCIPLCSFIYKMVSASNHL